MPSNGGCSRCLKIFTLVLPALAKSAPRLEVRKLWEVFAARTNSIVYTRCLHAIPPSTQRVLDTQYITLALIRCAIAPRRSLPEGMPLDDAAVAASSATRRLVSAGSSARILACNPTMAVRPLLGTLPCLLWGSCGHLLPAAMFCQVCNSWNKLLNQPWIPRMSWCSKGVMYDRDKIQTSAQQESV